jgi:MFS family permease
MAKLEALAEKKGAKPIEPRSKGYITFLVLFMGLVSLLDQYLSQIEGPAIPYIIEEFGVTAAEFALWQGIFGVIAFAVFFIAWFSDAFGRRKGILLLILTLGVPTLFIIFFSFNLYIFLLLYSIVIMGTVSNLWEIPVMEEAPAEKRGLYGGIAFLIGLIPLFAILGTTIAESIGWRWCYGVMFFYMIALVIMWTKMKEPQRWENAKEERQHEFLKIRTALKKLQRKDIQYILISTITYTIWGISFKLGVSWGGYYYMNIIGYSPDEYRAILTIGALLTMVGALLSGILLDKLGRNGTMIIGCGGSVVGFVGLGFTASPLFFWMIYLFMPVVLAWIMVYFGEIFPTEVRATCVGVCATSARSAYVIGPLLAFVLLVAFPDMVGFWIVGGLLMLIPILSIFMKPYETKGKTLEAIQEER